MQYSHITDDPTAQPKQSTIDFIISVAQLSHTINITYLPQSNSRTIIIPYPQTLSPMHPQGPVINMPQTKLRHIPTQKTFILKNRWKNLTCIIKPGAQGIHFIKINT